MGVYARLRSRVDLAPVFRTPEAINSAEYLSKCFAAFQRRFKVVLNVGWPDAPSVTLSLMYSEQHAAGLACHRYLRRALQKAVESTCWRDPC